MDFNGEAGLACRFEGVGAVEVGVVVADQVVEAVVLVHDPLGGGAEADGAVQGVACWGGDGGKWCFGGLEGRARGQDGEAWTWWVGEDEDREVDEAENR